MAKELDIKVAERVRGKVTTGVRAGAQTIHLKLKILGNDTPGEDTIKPAKT